MIFVDLEIQGQLNLAFCYEIGAGLEKDLKSAVRLYRQAANRGDHDAACRLGRFYEIGSGVKRDVNEARYIYQIAALQGSSLAKQRFDDIQWSASHKLRILW